MNEHQDVDARMYPHVLHVQDYTYDILGQVIVQVQSQGVHFSLVVNDEVGAELDVTDILRVNLRSHRCLEQIFPPSTGQFHQ